MRIRVSRTYIDVELRESDPANAEVAAGTERTVSSARGATLIGHGVAEEIKASRSSAKPAPQIAPSPPITTADPDIDAVSAPTT